MSKPRLTQKAALIIFVVLVVFVLAMAAWWIIFMAQLTDEKVEIAQELGAAPEYLDQLHEQEIARQKMVGSEGVVFLLLVLAGVLLIYRTLVQAERLRRHQENFLMAVTHELKTPLASIAVYLDTLQSSKIPEEKKQAVIPRMKLDLRRLERLVENILEAGRFDAAAFSPNRQRIDLSELLQSIASDLELYHPATQIRIDLKVDPDVKISADGPVIRRAIGAVLDNAVKYSGGSEADIAITLHRTNKDAEVVIGDRGIGIDKKERDAIFDRFYRLGSELIRASGGTGLGLHLCREMIRAHGGEVVARASGTGPGSEFVITLPLDESP